MVLVYFSNLFTIEAITVQFTADNLFWAISKLVQPIFNINVLLPFEDKAQIYTEDSAILAGTKLNKLQRYSFHALRSSFHKYKVKLIIVPSRKFDGLMLNVSSVPT